jgi:ribosomal protein L12E/L44/L45/RPP1/RPP2
MVEKISVKNFLFSIAKNTSDAHATTIAAELLLFGTHLFIDNVDPTAELTSKKIKEVLTLIGREPDEQYIEVVINHYKQASVDVINYVKSSELLQDVELPEAVRDYERGADQNTKRGLPKMVILMKLSLILDSYDVKGFNRSTALALMDKAIGIDKGIGIDNERKDVLRKLFGALLDTPGGEKAFYDMGRGDAKKRIGVTLQNIMLSPLVKENPKDETTIKQYLPIISDLLIDEKLSKENVNWALTDAKVQINDRVIETIIYDLENDKVNELSKDDIVDIYTILAESTISAMKNAVKTSQS